MKQIFLAMTLMIYGNSLLSSEGESPQERVAIEIKTMTRSFNHFNDYAIENGALWVRPRAAKDGEERTWRPMYFDGYPHATPKTLSVDGANLMVLDEFHQVHFKKVLKEYRAKELPATMTPDDLKQNLSSDPDYLAFDLSDLKNWDDKWFSYAFWHYVVNPIAGRFLFLDAKRYPIAVMSHRGHFNDYVEDHALQRHPVDAGVTSIYALSADGRSLRMYDPWVPKYVDISIYFPSSDESLYQSLNISVSASTVMSVGYRTDFAKSTRQLEILTRLSDIDTEGWNPTLKFAYTKNEKDPDVRVLPFDPQWTSHPLPDGARVTKNLTIRQTGRGNHARELRIEGCLDTTSCGIFSKMISENSWVFRKTSDHLKEPLLENSQEIREEMRKQLQESVTVHSYPAQIFVGDQKPISAKLSLFGPESHISDVAFVLNGKSHMGKLYRYHTWWTYLGMDYQPYHLVMPEADLFSSDGSVMVPVSLSKQNGQWDIKLAKRIF